MKRLLFLIIVLFCSLSLWSQLSVKSFRLLPDVKFAGDSLPVKDQNGDICALIKVLTTESDFSCDGGMSGIVQKIVKSDGFWLFIPNGSKRITISHDRLGVLRDYMYTEPIVSGGVYEMVLSGEKLKTIVVEQKEEEVTIVWVIVKSTPVGADFFVNDVRKGVTPLSFKMASGKYIFRLEKPKYNSLSGDLRLTGEEPDGKKEVALELKPALAMLKINSSPEDGATVSLDGVELGEKTPMKLENLKFGKYSITVRKEMFLPAVEEIVFNQNDTIEKTVQLKPNFGTVSVTAQPEVSIFMDSIQVGKGIFKSRIPAGTHTFEARKENLKFKKEVRTVQSGDNLNIVMVVQTDQGTIDINSEPTRAIVSINGVAYGKTPYVQKKMAIGTYNLKIEKEGYEPIVMPVKVEEALTSTVRVTLKTIPLVAAPADSAKSVPSAPKMGQDTAKTIVKIQKQVEKTYKQAEKKVIELFKKLK